MFSHSRGTSSRNSDLPSYPARRLRTLLAVGAAAAALVTGLIAAAPGSALPPVPDGLRSADGTPPATPPATPYAWITNRIGRMTLEEKVGQLFVTYAYGDNVDAVDSRNQSVHGVDTPAELIEKYHLGGVVYFAWSDNLVDPEQIAALSNGIQEVALDRRIPIPMLISTDQEQGIVNRVGTPATLFPGNMALGAGRSADAARVAAEITGTELRALGINQNYAPVADVNVNPENPVIGVRSFGEDPDLTAALTAAQVAGLQGSSVAATAKHFPGHGDTDVDSHLGVPSILHTKAEWWAIDAPPFEAAIEAGVDSIMTAHIVVPALDPSGDPATLSEPIITGVLRDELGHDGVVVTDSLAMQGVRDEYGDDRVPVLALQAGVDMLLMPPDTALAYDSVLDAVRSGEISERRIDESVYRILRLKAERGLFRDPFVDVGAIGDVLGTRLHQAEAQRITDATTTLVANDAGLLPLSAGDQEVLVTGWGEVTTQTLATAISAHAAAATDRARNERDQAAGPSTQVYKTGTNPSPAQIAGAAARADDADLVVLTTHEAWKPANSGQRALATALAATGTPVIAISVRDAYDVAHLDEVDTFLVTYSYTAGALESAAKVLFGEISPTGTLPVTVPVAGDPSTTLYPYGHGLAY